MAQTTVTRNDDAARYEIHVDGTLAGFLVTERRDGAVVLPHTRVFEEFGGQGLAGILVRDALTDLAAAGATVVPLCPVVAKFLRTRTFPGLTVAWPDRGEA